MNGIRLLDVKEAAMLNEGEKFRFHSFGEIQLIIGNCGGDNESLRGVRTISWADGVKVLERLLLSNGGVYSESYPVDSEKGRKYSVMLIKEEIRRAI
ncbi:MAG: hypothetical protein U9Q06_03425 [Nanoarchaeota archaeon]|nr:hypothetical protein [Nanoarchaeota archaeon]